MAVNKNTLVDRISQRTGMSKSNAAMALNATLEEIGASLAAGDSVSLIGFGSFEIRERAERMGRNPQTGQEITIPASKGVGFKAGKKLKDSL